MTIQSKVEDKLTTFKAGVQYNDYKGTVAADRADEIAFLDHIKELGLAHEGERLAGYRIVFNENHGAEISKPGVVAYLYEAEGFVEKPAAIRAIDVDIPIAKLFSFFKRFDLVLTIKDMDLEDVPVDGPHYD